MDGRMLPDPGTVAGVRDALAGGKAALAGEQETAAWLAALYPRLGDAIASLMEFHRRAAEWAVLGSAWAPPACGLLFLASGFPAPGDPPGKGPLHARALAAAPGARAVYCDASLRVFQVNRDLLAEPGRVDVMRGDALDPAAVFRRGGRGRPATPARRLLERARKAGRPLSLHAVMAPGRWPPAAAAAAVAGYAALLPPGSTVCLSLFTADPGAHGEQMTRDAVTAAGPAFAHTCEDVARWILDAGMALHPGGVRPVRGWGKPGWGDPYMVAPQVPGRPVGAVGIVR